MTKFPPFFLIATTLLVAAPLARKEPPSMNICIESFSPTTGDLVVHLKNDSDEDKRIWDEEFSEGYFSFSVLIRSTDLGGLRLINRTMKGFVRDFSTPLTIPKRGEVELRFCLYDGSWKIEKKQLKNVAEVKFNISIAPTKATKNAHVWSGFTESEWIKVKR